MKQKQQVQQQNIHENIVFGYLIFERHDICKLKSNTTSPEWKMSQFDQYRGVFKIYKNDVFKFGRDPNQNSLSIPSNLYVSNQHFKIWGVQFESDMSPTLYVKDTSLNGILINGKRLGKGKITYLKDEDVIEIKHAVRMKFEKYNSTPDEDFEEYNDDTTVNSIVSVKSSDSSSSSRFLDVSMEWEISNEVLGKGTFGKVYIGKRKFQLQKNKHRVNKCVSVQKNVIGNSNVKKSLEGISPLICAVKIIKVKNLEVQMNESLVLSRLNHPNIVKIFETKVHAKHFIIYEELLTGGDLFSYLTNEKSGHLRGVAEHEALLIMYQLLQGLEYLHSSGIVHRDLKLDNLLLSGPRNLFERIVICDFGTACCVSWKTDLMTVDYNYSGKYNSYSKNSEKYYMSSITGTVEYCAPEVGFEQQYIAKNGRFPTGTSYVSGNKNKTEKSRYNFKCDMWSVGVIFHILLSGVSPFYGTGKEWEMIQNAKRGLQIVGEQYEIGYFKDEQGELVQVSCEATDLLCKLVERDISKRFDSRQCLSHPWIFNNLQLLEKIYVEKILADE